jgi:hypothetical protein
MQNHSEIHQKEIPKTKMSDILKVLYPIIQRGGQHIDDTFCMNSKKAGWIYLLERRLSFVGYILCE